MRTWSCANCGAWTYTESRPRSACAFCSLDRWVNLDSKDTLDGSITVTVESLDISARQDQP